MAYKGYPQFSHNEQPKVGVLITNLGTPAAPTTKALRRYLGEFLSDPRVIEVPRILWKCILHGVILRIRPRRSAAAYRTVWQPEGSPLMIHTKHQKEALHRLLTARYGNNIVVDFAMRYGDPSVEDALDSMLQQGVRQLLVLPMYPQYSASTTGSTFDAIAKAFMQRRWLPDLRFISHYHDEPSYIDILALHIQKHWQDYGRADKLIFSYHGLPMHYLKQGDPYHCECLKTSRLVAERLRLSKDDYMTTFQSRFGREEWLKPYTDHTLQALPEQGIQSVQLICPGFSADCLETLEEIAVENKEYFMEAGGERYEYIPALNACDEHIAMLGELVGKHLQGWPMPGHDEGATMHKHFKAYTDN